MHCCEFTLPNVVIAQLKLQFRILMVAGSILGLEVVDFLSGKFLDGSSQQSMATSFCILPNSLFIIVVSLDAVISYELRDVKGTR